MNKRTEDLWITETHLLLPIIWEGDLNIHSNEPLMKKSRFQNIILHGDTIFSLATALVEKQECPFSYIYELETTYKKSVTIGDKIYVEYKIHSLQKYSKVSFNLYKNKHELVMNGSLKVELQIERR